MLAKEIERTGIPVALITALASVAEGTLAQRIVQAKAIANPTGDSQLTADREKQLRRSLIEKALDAIGNKVEKRSA